MNRNFSIHSSALSYPRGAATVPASRPSRVPAAGTVEIPSRRQRVGENHAAGALGAITHANSNLFPLPSGSMRDQAGRLPLEPLNLSQSFRDVVAVGFAFLFVLSVALAFIGAIFLALFCRF